MKNNYWRIAALVLLSTCVAACTKKQVLKNVSDTAKVVLENISNQELGGDKKIEVLTRVFFPFDSAELDESARLRLYQNSFAIKKAMRDSSRRIMVEGHCDQRGTQAYNLALGERRARAIVEYYKYMGIPETRIDHVSYGAEILFCEEDTNDCWEKNRRGETALQ